MPRKTPSGPENTEPRYSRKDPVERRREIIDAAIACLADGGIAGFTIERICRQARISRGLISHHFDGKDDLLACAYEAMTRHLTAASRNTLSDTATDPAAALRAVIELNFAADMLKRDELRAWLAVWGEVAGNARLKKLHRERYPAYRDSIAVAIAALARDRNRQVDSLALAKSFVALVDGLWLEWCLDPTLLSADDAKRAAYELLEARLGPIRKV